jgi:hypothetical protein
LKEVFGSNPMMDDDTKFLIVYQFNFWRARMLAFRSNFPDSTAQTISGIAATALERA